MTKVGLALCRSFSVINDGVNNLGLQVGDITPDFSLEDAHPLTSGFSPEVIRGTKNREAHLPKEVCTNVMTRVGLALCRSFSVINDGVNNLGLQVGDITPDFSLENRKRTRNPETTNYLYHE